MRSKRTRKMLSLTAGLLFCAPVSALAVDGVIEINHVAALAGGVTGTDAPGYPVTIDAAGSYRLTADLLQPDASTHVIEVSADRVTIDLNGFGILGANVCTEQTSVVNGSTVVTAVNCTANGVGFGISAGTANFISVRNGRIVGMGSTGVLASGNATFERLVVAHCGSTGIQSSDFSSALHSSATNTGSRGVVLGSYSRVESFTATNNNGNGVQRGAGCVVRSVTSHRNNGDGISVGAMSSVSRVTAAANDGGGIQTVSNSRVTDCVVRQNAQGGLSNAGNTSAVSGCVFAFNGVGTFTGVVEIGANLCGGSTTCP